MHAEWGAAAALRRPPKVASPTALWPSTAQAEHDDRKRKYNSGASYEVSAEEMEAYHRMKKRDSTGDMADPMANFKDVV